MTDLLWIALAGVFIGVTWWQHRILLRSNRGIARQAAKDAASTTAALGSIHALVNSNLTAARADQLDATRVMLASLRELASYKESQGVAVSQEAAEAIELAQKRVDELARDLVHKQQQTTIADAQVERGRG
jgi:DNA uptake protein ComE-like DNA-binding protein